jgi:hypothetical protein
MATKQAAGYKQKGFLAGILVTVGAAALLADLAFLAQPLAHLFDSAKSGLFGFVPALGLSALNAARAVALHQVGYFSLVSRILVLFSALVAVVVGTALWNARQAPEATQNRNNLLGSVQGDR